MVGDRVDKDIVHANRLGCISVLLQREKGRYRHLEVEQPEEKPMFVVQGLLEIKDIVGQL